MYHPHFRCRDLDQTTNITKICPKICYLAISANPNSLLFRSLNDFSRVRNVKMQGCVDYLRHADQRVSK
jgi:hypothetical protein